MKNLLLSILLAIGACCSSRPEQQKRTIVIFDSAKLLSPVQTDSIRTLIDELESTIGSQVGIIIIESLRGQNIDEYSLREANRMRLGRKDFDDGVLITLALNDRRMRIEVGIGLENIIRDELASDINQNVMAPEFRKGNYGLGIYRGVDNIKSLIELNKERVGETPEHRKRD